MALPPIITTSTAPATLYTNDPTGLGLTNISFLLMTNQVPAFGITNIPVLINGNFVYSPAVNRLLQLAANIYDATTNSFITRMSSARLLRSIMHLAPRMFSSPATKRCPA